MSSSPDASVMRRMVAPPRPPSESPSGGADDTHIRVQFPRGGDELLGLSLDVTAVSEQTLSQTEIIDLFGEHDLIYTLHRSGTGIGLAVVDAGLLAALIEVQTTGRVAATPTPERIPSRTDAVVASDIVDRWLRDLSDGAASGGGAGAAFQEAHRGERHLDPRAVALTLDPGQYSLFKVTMSLGNGARHGNLFLTLPVSSGGEADRRRKAGVVDVRSVMNPVSAELLVDMARFPVRLSMLTGLSEGTLIPFPPGPLGRATLRAINGRDVAVVALGQADGRWAIRQMPPQTGSASHADVPAFGDMSLAGDQEVPPALPDLSAGGVAELEIDHQDTPADVDLPPLPDLPELPDLPAPSGSSDLPDLPPLPDLPDLPPLGDDT